MVTPGHPSSQGSASHESCVTACTRAGSTCGSCKPVVKSIVEEYFESVGRTVDRSLCEHFPLTRQELFDVVAVHVVHVPIVQVVHMSVVAHGGVATVWTVLV